MWEHLGFIKSTWPGKFWRYILALTHNRKSIFLICYMSMFERLSLARSLEYEEREQLQNGKSYSMPWCPPRNSGHLEHTALRDFLVLLKRLPSVRDSQPGVTNASVDSRRRHVMTDGKLCRKGHWSLGSLREESLIPETAGRPEQEPLERVLKREGKKRGV